MLVVGAPIRSDQGDYESYFFYPLTFQEETLNRLTNFLVLVSVGLLAAVIVMAAILIGRVLRPVQRARDVAEEIAAGNLEARIPQITTNDDFGRLAESFNRMTDALAQKIGELENVSNLQARFVSDVSHELRTPLTAIRGEIEVALRADRSPREYQGVLHSALEEIDRMTTMTEELLLISRAEAGLIGPQREPTDVDALVGASLERLRDRIADKELRVEHVEAPSDGRPPSLDPALLRRLVDELLENAVTYSEPGGQVVVHHEDRANRMQLVVENTGPGISAADLPHLFDPYFRADDARTRGAGTGLGLTTAIAIARLHGGTIRAANREGGGARFEVDLPSQTIESGAGQ